MFFFTVLPPGSAWAQKRYEPRAPAVTGKYGREVKVLPRSHRVVRAGKMNYHYANGFYYRPKGPHWVSVRPPLGIVVAALTAAAVLVSVSGVHYYLSEGVYYRKIPAGYEVVEVDAAPGAVPFTGQRVQVTAQFLNVRSGPGKEHGTIRQVPQGTVLTIRGSAPDWLYIALDDGTFGWVMAAFTVVVHPAAQG
jgi:hypothetical protein